MIAEFAAAKVNLSLRVTGRRADGYHLLDSLVVFADIGDVLTFEAGGAFALSISGPFAAGLAADETNLVMIAATRLAQAFPGRISPARISLAKNLPIAAGIGGGSADAAATLRGLCRLSGIAPPLDALALSLGADVPACLKGRACRMRGIGEEIEEISDFAPRHAVLVNPGIAIATRDVFARLAASPTRGHSVNDLETSARAMAPVIGEVITALEAQLGVEAAGMSGSGATCFGLFKSAADAGRAAGQIGNGHPAWWCQATLLS